MSGLTISNGVSEGAGVFNSGRLALDNCTFTGNSADNDWGGGILDVGQALIVNHCVFSNNFGGGNEMANIEVVKSILQRLNKPENLISYVTDRLGHDRRYAIDSSFAERELKWKPQHSFEQGLAETIAWYLANESWWQPLLERAGRY